MAFSTQVQLVVNLQKMRHDTELGGSFPFWSDSYFILMANVETLALAAGFVPDDITWFNQNFVVRTNSTGVAIPYVAGGNSFTLTSAKSYIFTFGESDLLDVQLKELGYASPATVFPLDTLANYAINGVNRVFTVG